MEFDIYSIGESAFLEQVLNAVAMITGEDSFRDAVAIGMLLGVLLTAWQLLTGGGKGGVDISQIVVCLILYMCMFVPRATVVIEDAYTGAVRPVDNVPVGVAAVGSMLSSVGYGLTRLFEQGYAPVVPGITETQFADALKILNDVRRRAGEPKVFHAINVALGDGSMSNLQNGTAGGIDRFPSLLVQLHKGMQPQEHRPASGITRYDDESLDDRSPPVSFIHSPYSALHGHQQSVWDQYDLFGCLYAAGRADQRGLFDAYCQECHCGVRRHKAL